MSNNARRVAASGDVAFSPTANHSFSLASLCRSVGARLGAIILVMAAVIVTLAWQGWSGMRASNAALNSVYRDRAAPTGQLGDVIDRMRDNLQQMTLLVIDLRDGSEDQTIQSRIRRIEDNVAAIESAWRDIAA
ncbi:MAG TPA: MCP four helix bundle domain-containing protein, partial [Azospirillaceae bacterium]|nr:MCP four helix bundle domain-containing protein [Azospirillaceae bacterium]